MLAMTMVMPTSTWAGQVMFTEFYRGTLTFKYGDKQGRWEIYDVPTSTDTPLWIREHKADIKKVVFDPSFQEALPTSCAHWFDNCSNLTSINNIEYLNTANVTDMNDMFNNCSGLISLDLSSFNTANVEYMSYMFNGCSGLTTIYVSDDFTTNKVSESDYMFSGCTSLKGAVSYNSGKTGIDMANFDGYFTPKIITPYVKWDANTKVLTFKVANTKEEGSGVYDLNEGATAPGWSISEVKNNCTNVVFTPSFNHAKPTSCYKWFYYFEKLTTIQGIENLYTDNVENMGYMFYYCSKLTSVDVSKFNTAKVTDMSNMFYFCLNLTSLDVSKFNTAKVTDMSHMFDTCLKLTSLDVSKFNTAKVTNMNYMFGDCEGLISLDVSKFNTAEVTDMSNMFWYCIGLTSLDLSSFNTAKVTDMSNMFYFCKSLTSLDLSSFNTANVTYMSYMFNTCLKLTSLDLSSFNTAKVTNMMNMFSDCPVLTSLDLSSFNTAKVTNMAYMFKNCSGLTTIYVSDDFTISNVSSQSNLFDNCSKLKGAIAFNSDRKDKSMANYTTGYFSYGIKTVEDWNNFADKVNNGYTTMCAGLLKDITDANVLTTIGSNGFTGTFDGFGHTISGLNFNSTFSALFVQNGGTIKNLGILNATIAEGASGNICQTNSGTIESCYFMGTTTGSTQSAGGICPTNDGITKCYYLADEDNGNGGKTEEQFISGEVAYLLSQGAESSVWGQQLGTDNNPVLSEYKVIRSAKGDNNTYWATFSNQNSDVTLSVPSPRDLYVYNATVSGGTLTLSERTENQVAKGEGVLLKTDGEYVNAKANETNELTGETYANNNLVATPATEQTITAETGYTLYRLTYNNVSTKEGLGFYLGLVKNEDGKVDETSRGKKLNATPGKAYLKVATEAATDPSTSKLALGFAFPDNDDETVTGISGVTVSDRIQTSDRIYDLQGRPVVNPTKGVYIRNGRKVVY